MKKTLLATILAFAASAAFAQAWQWTDAQGRKQISDSPPPEKAKNIKEIPKHTPPEDLISDEERAAQDAKSDEEFKKRREERLKREEEEQKAAQEARERRAKKK